MDISCKKKNTIGCCIEWIVGYNEKQSLEDKMLTTIIFSSMIAGFVLFIGDLIQQFGPKIYLFSLFGSIAFAILFLFARKVPNKKVYIIIYCILLIVVVVFVWFNNGGIAGSSLFYLMPIIFVVPLFAKGIFRLISILIPVAIGLFLLIYEIENPEIITLSFSKNTLKIDMFLSAVFVAATVLLILILNLYSYNKEHAKVIALSESKDKFLSIISHELRNPVGALNGLGEVLSEGHNEMTSEKRQELIDTIVKSSSETYNLLDNLLLWARSEAGHLNVKKSKIDVNELFEDSLEILNGHFRSKNLDLRRDIDQDLFVFADNYMLGTVFRNLLTNAIKFTPEGGCINVSAKYVDNKKKVEIAFRDNGIGIKEEKLKLLFNSCSVYSSKGTNNERGTGLGLRICEEFISKNEGEITVESEINIGTEFKILLPSWNSINTST